VFPPFCNDSAQLNSHYLLCYALAATMPVLLQPILGKEPFPTQLTLEDYFASFPASVLLQA